MAQQACSSVADGAVSRFAHSRDSVHAGHRHAVRTRAMSPPSTPDPEVSSSRRAFIIIGASVASSVVPTMAPARAESAASVDTLQRSLVAAYEVQDFTAALDALRSTAAHVDKGTAAAFLEFTTQGAGAFLSQDPQLVATSVAEAATSPLSPFARSAQ